MTQKNKTKKGFSLIEALIAVFIFSIAMMALLATFSGFLKNYANSKRIQKDVENAQYAMNLMAKTLRTSTVGVVTNNFPLDVYDHSQDRCIRYRRHGSRIQYRSNPPATSGDPATCDYTSGAFSDLISANIVSASVNATMTVGDVFGLVTIALGVRDPNSASANPILVQTSVSLRQ